MLQILTRFKEKYKPLLKKGLVIEGMVVIDHARRKNAISVSKPFIFDNRNIPKSFDGIQVKKRITGEMPVEFQIDRSQPDWHKREYIWAPERFEQFVDRAIVEIREKLGEADLNREEALDAICFGDFEEHSRKVKRLIREGKVPSYNKANNLATA
ncbi:MAG: hypothetical protein CL840_17710 [Crocinitomicaceae bacterium]|nr:hypothetical protein [Crocinitomicaceae bacterium]|tara:strand:+ start:23406 stop:23870 length:465 start_codon:yes stop_codon:yes gene_type:complete